MTEKSGVINGVGEGGEEAATLNATPQSVDVVDEWKRVAQINMKAIQQVCTCIWFVFVLVHVVCEFKFAVGETKKLWLGTD